MTPLVSPAKLADPAVQGVQVLGPVQLGGRLRRPEEHPDLQVQLPVGHDPDVPVGTRSGLRESETNVPMVPRFTSNPSFSSTW